MHHALNCSSPRPGEMNALDLLYSESQRFRESTEYMAMLDFVSRLRDLAPFNAWLLYMQNPKLTYVARAEDWMRRFGRTPRPDARPYVVMFPFGPVNFVFDLMETEGKPFPEGVLNPFPIRGAGFMPLFENLLHNCGVHRTTVDGNHTQLIQAGQAIRLDLLARREYSVKAGQDFLILLNQRLPPEVQFAALAHELAHIFCGHLGRTGWSWWESCELGTEDQREIEAESVAFLVTRRLGLHLESERYLVKVRNFQRLLPAIRPNVIFQATSYIEAMTKEPWKGPRRKPGVNRVGK